MHSPRPTLRCLREDLGLPLPAVTIPLDETDHPIVAKTAELFTDTEAKHERIRAIDDQVMFKVKVQRWRGAVWIDADLPWLVAAGRREDGSMTWAEPRSPRATTRLPARFPLDASPVSVP